MIDVLVVDDDFMVARIHRSYVQRVPGFTVVGEAHTAEAALLAVDDLLPDLVLLDVHLPDASGLDVLRHIRQRPDSDVDVIVITASRDVETVRSAMHGGVVSYLVKPFTLPTFVDRLQRYADGRRRLPSSGELAQDEVDRAFELVRPPGTAVLPKGLSAGTCRLVEQALQSAGTDLSAAEAALATGISRVSARRYLEHLSSVGRVSRRSRYGQAGRPEHRYSVQEPAAPA